MKRFFKSNLAALIELALMLPPCLFMSVTIIRTEFFDAAYRQQLAENVRKYTSEWLVIEYGLTAAFLGLYLVVPVVFALRLIRHRHDPPTGNRADVWLGGVAILLQYGLFLLILFQKVI